MKGRILAIDYGTKRCGLAVTDPMQLIATGLTTISTEKLLDHIGNYIRQEKVENIIIGNPKKLNNSPSETAQHVTGFIKKLRKKYPEIDIELMDERFTSVMAQKTMIEAGSTKKQRQNRGTLDMISAVILLQNYLESKKFSP